MFKFRHINEAKSFLVEKLSSERFLASASDFAQFSCFVAPYPPEQQAEAALVAKAVVQELGDKGVKAVVANVYDIVLDILDNEDLWDPVTEIEGEMDKEAFIQALKDAVDLESQVIPRLLGKVEESNAKILIIDGIGSCYPFLRAHRLLNVLDAPVPVLLLFPGKYSVLPDGSTSLDILSTPAGKGGAHYPARNIFGL